MNPVLSGKNCRVALAQLATGLDKQANIRSAIAAIKRAKEQGAEIVVLPECFNSPYGTSYFAEYAEEVPKGPTAVALANAAKENTVWLIGGSIPEVDRGTFFNTTMVFDRHGNFIDKYRKVTQHS